MRGGGFSEQRRAPGVYEVWFAGNTDTSADQSDDFALLRAADLCLAEKKPFMRTSNFKSGTAFQGTTPATPIRRSVPVEPTMDNPNGQPRPAIVGFAPGRKRYTTLSSLRVECLAEIGKDAQEAAAVALSIRVKYKPD